MIVANAAPSAAVPPRPQPGPDRDTLIWTISRFQDADRAWTGILPTILRNNTPRHDDKIHAAMHVGMEQAIAGAKVIEEMTGLPMPRNAFLRDGDRYTQVQHDLSQAIYDAKYVDHGDSTQAMQAILAVRGAIAGLNNILQNNHTVDRVFPEKIMTGRPR